MKTDTLKNDALDAKSKEAIVADIIAQHGLVLTKDGLNEISEIEKAKEELSELKRFWIKIIWHWWVILLALVVTGFIVITFTFHNWHEAVSFFMKIFK
jgi:hypothetical protein